MIFYYIATKFWSRRLSCYWANRSQLKSTNDAWHKLVQDEPKSEILLVNWWKNSREHNTASVGTSIVRNADEMIEEIKEIIFHEYM